MKKKYIIPVVEIEKLDSSYCIAISLNGGEKEGDDLDLSGDAKRNIFASFDLEDSNDDWGNIWADETEEY